MGAAVDTLTARRLANWRQTPETRIAGLDDAPALINACGLVTLYPASPEVPNLFHAYMGDPTAKTDSHWDSAAGQVYTWRWLLGRREAGFYGVLVRKRPTWISWELLPAVLRLFSESRMPDELRDLGVISEGAYRIVQALEHAGGVLETTELRTTAGFPNGSRAAFLKALDELDARLLLGKVFLPGDEDMRHALIYLRYREYAEAADRMTREQAMDAFLRAYLPHAVYVVPVVLARHLRLGEAEMRAGLDTLAVAGLVQPATLAGYKGACYVWTA